ncbi:hypothetical protein E4T66_16245 [Sinimarinibacterium sp. CAU 1509]|nr:hypothetical protein E4T66_16245 [Sinimarinibacterium sp. CAU 1509]
MKADRGHMGRRIGVSILFWLFSAGSAAAQVDVNTCSLQSDVVSLTFCEVTPEVLWRGAQPDSDGAAWLLKNQVRTIVNLELVHDDLPVFEQLEIDDDLNQRIGYFRIREWEPLPLLAPFIVDAHVAHFLAVVATQPPPIFVHCRAGRNRTGVMVAAYRILIEGLPVEDAIAELKRFHGAWSNVGAHYLRGLNLQRRTAILREVAEWKVKLEPTAYITCVNGGCTVTPD